MPVDYTDWPTVTHVQTGLSAAGVTPRLDGTALEDHIERKRQAVIQEVGRVTRRQFVADPEDTTRPFDGSGLCELEVDEMVSLASVEVVGPVLVPYYSFSVEDGHVALKYPGVGKPKTTLMIVGPGGVPPIDRYAVFPEGRQNVAVTGVFGFAETIPVDLWEAVAEEIADRVIREAVYTPEGRVTRFESDQFSEQYKLDDPDLIRGSDRYRSALALYAKPRPKRSRRYTSFLA